MSDRKAVNRSFRAAAILLATAGLGVFAGPVPAADRIALVIGNAQYSKFNPLTNPVNDAQAMADKLRSFNFKLVGGKAHLNVTRNSMLRLLNELETTVRPSKGATALVYYSGHGLATDGDNWLVPVDDGDIAVREDVPDYAVSARRGILRRLEDREGGLNIVILDACRNNELPARRETRGTLTKGLAQFKGNPPDTLLAYAAAPGDVAYDGDGSLSPYVGALLAEMEIPGKRLVDVMNDTAKAVRRATEHYHRGPQKPHFEFHTLPAAFYFIPAPGQERPRQAEQPHESPKIALRVEKGSEQDKVAGRKLEIEGPARDPVLAKEFKDCPQCPRMVVIPAGAYDMGSPSGAGARDKERRHRVTIPRPIAVGMFEVQRGEFTRFMKETKRSGGSACWQYDGVETKEGSGPTDAGFIQGENEPMVCVSWTDAKAYVDWLSKKTKKKYRLLSESEWEYAARGTTVTSRYWDKGGSGQCANANGADEALKTRYSNWFELTAPCDDGSAHTSEAGRYGPNEFGLYDMLGNAREWVEDCWHRDHGDAPSDGTARTDGGNCALRVLRGGSWLDGPGGVRSSTRDKGTTGIRYSANGFRVARSLD